MKKRETSGKARAAGEPMAKALEAVKDQFGALGQVLSHRDTCEASAIVEAIRNSLGRFWASMFKLGIFPLSKREADMHVAISRNLVKRLGKEMLDRLPKSLTALYLLSRLDQSILEGYIEKQFVTPATTVPAARALLKENQEPVDRANEKIRVEQYFKKFASFVSDTLERWTPEQRECAAAELMHMMQQIRGHSATSTFPCLHPGPNLEHAPEIL